MPAFESSDPTRIDSTCIEMIGQFFKDRRIKVIQDDQTSPGSYYIRDRACIQGIRGTPSDLVTLLAEKGYIWLDPTDPKRFFKKETHGNICMVLVAALKGVEKELASEVYNKLEANILQFLPEPRWDDPSRSKEEIRKELSDIQDQLLQVVHAHQRCAQKGNLAEFSVKVPEKTIRFDSTILKALCNH